MLVCCKWRPCENNNGIHCSPNAVYDSLTRNNCGENAVPSIQRAKWGGTKGKSVLAGGSKELWIMMWTKWNLIIMTNIVDKTQMSRLRYILNSIRCTCARRHKPCSLNPEVSWPQEQLILLRRAPGLALANTPRMRHFNWSWEAIWKQDSNV